MRDAPQKVLVLSVSMVLSKQPPVMSHITPASYHFEPRSFAVSQVAAGLRCL